MKKQITNNKIIIMKTKQLITLLLISIIFLMPNSTFCKNEDIIIDSKMTFEESIKGTNAPVSIINNLCLLDVEYYSFDNKLHKGQILIHKDISKDVKEVFELIKKLKFPVKEVIPIVQYNWSDSLSMAKNNTSAFNYRVVAGTNKLSNHSYGLAFDLNPFQNPYVSSSKKITPIGAKYKKKKKGTVYSSHEIVKFLKDRGWTWGGDWITIKDYQHFEKK